MRSFVPIFTRRSILLALTATGALAVLPLPTVAASTQQYGRGYLAGGYA